MKGQVINIKTKSVFPQHQFEAKIIWDKINKDKCCITNEREKNDV